MSHHAPCKPISKAVRHSRHRSEHEHHANGPPRDNGGSWHPNGAEIGATNDKSTSCGHVSEFGEYLPSKTRRASFDSGYSEATVTSHGWVRNLAPEQAYGPEADESSETTTRGHPNNQGATRLATSSHPAATPERKVPPRSKSQRTHRPAPLRFPTDPPSLSPSSDATIRPGHSRSSSESTGVRKYRAVQRTLSGASHKTPATSPLAISSFTEEDLTITTSFSCTLSPVDSLGSFIKPLPRRPDSPPAPVAAEPPSRDPQKSTQFYFPERPCPPNVTFSQASSPESKGNADVTPADDVSSTDELARAKALYRRSSLDYRFDIREILDALEDAHGAFLRKDVAGIRKAKDGFLAAVDVGMMLLNTLPDAVRGSEAVEHALAEVNTYRNVFSGFCATVSAAQGADQLEERCCLGLRLLALLWTALGEFVTTCAVAVDAHEANQQGLPQHGRFDDDDKDGSVRAVQKKLAKELRRDSRQSIKGFLANAVRRVLPKTSIDEATSPAGSEISWLVVEHTAKSGQSRGSAHEPEAGALLNLDIKSTKFVFDTISRHYLSREDPPPLTDNPEVRTDANGRPVAMSLHALLDHIVDGFECTAADTDILATTDAFFLFLPCITDGARILEMLADRFSARPPSSLDRRAAARWHASQVVARIQIVRLLAHWLEQHLMPQNAKDLLPSFRKIRDAAEADAGLPPDIVTGLSAALVECERRVAARAQALYPPSFERMLRVGEGNRPHFKESGLSAAAEARVRDAPVVVTLLFFAREDGGVEELARALTLIESEIFHDAAPFTMYYHRDDKQHPMFAKAKAWSNALYLWTMHSVIEKATMGDRADAYNLLARVMDRCLELRNYSTAFSIMNGLLSEAVQRLRGTLRFAHVFCKKMVSKANEYFNQSGLNHSTYRADITSNVAPAVPLFHVLQGDITKIYTLRRMAKEEVGPLPDRDSSAGRWVYLQHIKQLRNVVRDLEKCYALYGVPVKPAVRDWLEKSVGALAGKNVEEYKSVLLSREVADEKICWLDRKL